MEEIINCSICFHQFDTIRFIPKILECGHTFCSPCLKKVIQNSRICPNCRTKIKEVEKSLPINFTTLKAVDIYKSLNMSEREIVATIEDLKKKCVEEIDKCIKKKTQLSLSLQIFDECFAKLEGLSLSQSFKVDTVNAKEILNEVYCKLQKHGEHKKTNLVSHSDDIKISVSIRLSSFKDPEAYLLEIFKRVKNKENLFAVHKIGDEVKYGEISLCNNNQLLFHSLTSSEAPNKSFILFDDLKQCVNHKNFFTFIKINCNKKNLRHILIMKMFPLEKSHHFIKLCTGEYGPCYKGASFKKGESSKDFQNILTVENFIENGQQCSRAIDYNFTEICLEWGSQCKNGQIYLYMADEKNEFEIFIAKHKDVYDNIVGRVISPPNFKDCINYDHSSNLKIVDCGIIVEV